MPGQPHVGVSTQENNSCQNVDLPPMSSPPISILQLAHRSKGTCGTFATIELACDAEDGNDVR